MITKHDHARRQTCADTTITDVIRQALVDNFERIPFTNEGGLFDDPYGDGQDNFEYTTYAGDPKLPFLITTILKNHFGFKENSHLVAHTYCEVDYFRKDPASCASHQVKS